jgi:hypothetical protein
MVFYDADWQKRVPIYSFKNSSRVAHVLTLAKGDPFTQEIRLLNLMNFGEMT